MNDDLQRYSRQIVLREVGVEGQRKLREAKVLVVGVGGLGAPLALYLAAAGVGTIGLVDGDVVALNNLHRQILYGEDDMGSPKVVPAARELERRSNVEVRAYREMLTPENAREIVSQFDIVCDGTDNFAVRYLLNDLCIELGKPNVHASVFQFQGQLSVFGLQGGPCYRCLFPSPPDYAPNCAEAGVLGVLPGVLGVLQATEAIKLILGIGNPLVGRLLIYDALAAAAQEVKFKRDPQCPCCGPNPDKAFLERAYSQAENCEMNVPEITPAELKLALDSANPPIVVDVREEEELEISALPSAIHIPIGEIPQRLGELDPSQDLVILCRSGARSARVTMFLLGQGFNNVRNVATGINGWAQTVDPTVPTY